MVAESWNSSQYRTATSISWRQIKNFSLCCCLRSRVALKAYKLLLSHCKQQTGWGRNRREQRKSKWHYSRKRTSSSPVNFLTDPSRRLTSPFTSRTFQPVAFPHFLNRSTQKMAAVLKLPQFDILWFVRPARKINFYFLTRDDLSLVAFKLN